MNKQKKYFLTFILEDNSCFKTIILEKYLGKQLDQKLGRKNLGRKESRSKNIGRKI